MSAAACCILLLQCQDRQRQQMLPTECHQRKCGEAGNYESVSNPGFLWLFLCILSSNGIDACLQAVPSSAPAKAGPHRLKRPPALQQPPATQATSSNGDPTLPAKKARVQAPSAASDLGADPKLNTEPHTVSPNPADGILAGGTPGSAGAGQPRSVADKLPATQVLSKTQLPLHASAAANGSAAEGPVGAHTPMAPSAANARAAADGRNEASSDTALQAAAGLSFQQTSPASSTAPATAAAPAAMAPSRHEILHPEQHIRPSEAPPAAAASDLMHMDMATPASKSSGPSSHTLDRQASSHARPSGGAPNAAAATVSQTEQPGPQQAQQPEAQLATQPRPAGAQAALSSKQMPAQQVADAAPSRPQQAQQPPRQAERAQHASSAKAAQTADHAMEKSNLHQKPLPQVSEPKAAAQPAQQLQQQAQQQPPNMRLPGGARQGSGAERSVGNPPEVQVVFMGTGSAEPQKYRGASAIHVKYVCLHLVLACHVFSGHVFSWLGSLHACGWLECSNC